MDLQCRLSNLQLLLLSLSIALVCYLFVASVVNYRRCNFDGPFLAKISGAWLFKHTASGKLYLDCAEEIKKYGSPFRIAPDKIMTNDPVLLRHMSAPRSNFKRGSFYDAMTLDPDSRNVLSERDDKLHNILRAKLIRGYSGKEIPSLESDIDARVLDLLALVRSESAAGKSVDFSALSQYFTLDVLTHIAFGAPFGYLTRNEDVYDYVKEVSGFLNVLELGANCPRFQAILSSRFVRPLRPKPTDPTGMGAMIGVAKKAVAERYGPDAKHIPDMLGSFVKNGLNQQEAETEAMLQILGGSDSTATAIRMIMLHILSNPRVHAKLAKELDSQAPNFSTPVITSAESRKLPYLQACIKEGLRIWPPLQSLQSKISPPGGETVNGVFIPGGIEVAHSSMTTQRRKEIYGEDTDFYIPERWTEAAARDDEGEKYSEMEKHMELIFGNGRFQCLGKHIAMIELDKVIPSLLREFEWEVKNPANPIKSKCFGVFVQTDFWLRATERTLSE